MARGSLEIPRHSRPMEARTFDYGDVGGRKLWMDCFEMIDTSTEFSTILSC